MTDYGVSKSTLSFILNKSIPGANMIKPATEAVCSELALKGHDSQLSTFLHEDYMEQLAKHPNAKVPLWTLGTLRDGMLRTVPMWNGSPGCFAWTYQPNIQKCEDSKDFVRYRGFVCNSELFQVESLVLIEHYFNQSFTAALNDISWIASRADPSLERLRYIRGYFGNSTDSPDWMTLQADYFDWCLNALDCIPNSTT